LEATNPSFLWTVRADAQAKSLGEELRARIVDLPLSLAGGR
jgi:hypothetical protein